MFETKGYQLIITVVCRLVSCSPGTGETELEHSSSAKMYVSCSDMIFFFKMDYVIRIHDWVLKNRSQFCLCCGMYKEEKPPPRQRFGGIANRGFLSQRSILSTCVCTYRYYLARLERHWQETDDGMTFFFCLSHVEKLALLLCCANKSLSQNLSALETRKWLKTTHQWHPNSHVCK